MTSSLNGKVALVTGGSRGIGRAISIKLASMGAKVFINYTSRQDAAEEVLKECSKYGSPGEILGFSVADSGAVSANVDSIIEKSGRLDVLVNNAGISKDGLFIRLKDDDWMQTLNVNLSGSFFCSRAAAKSMMKARSGRIINISSIVGETGNTGQVPYCASKAGLLGLTKAMAKELSTRGITVNAITPGFIETEMTGGLSDSIKEETLKQIPLGRYGSAEDIANLVAFLASDDASYITGQVIGVNGGMRM